MAKFEIVMEVDMPMVRQEDMTTQQVFTFANAMLDKLSGKEVEFEYFMKGSRIVIRKIIDPNGKLKFEINLH